MSKPKKLLFVDTGRNHGTVILNCVGTPEHEFGFYGEAFHAAGKSLVQQLKNDRRFGLGGPPLDSFRALPIVYMYRHGMELYLKDIILAGAEVLPLRGKARVQFRPTHKLEVLLRGVAQIFEAFGWDWDFALPHFQTLANFRSIIAELDSVEEIRYPIRREGGAVLPSNFRFNLSEFCEILDPVYQVLDGAAYAARGRLESEYEMRAEARQYAMENYDPSDQW